MVLFNILLGALALFLGALGSHLTLENIDISDMNKFEIAQRYHMFHVLLVLVEVLMIGNDARDFFLKISMVFIIVGVLCFCGSIYAAFFFKFDYLNFLTPIGGGFLVIGWITLFVAVLARDKFV